MDSLLIIGIFVSTFVLSSSNPRTAAVIDIAAGMVILFYRLIPGTASFFDCMAMSLLFITAGFLFFVSEVEKRRTLRTYIKSFKATFRNDTDFRNDADSDH